MKVLFLIGHRSGQSISDYFQFEPYLYGPYSFEVYQVLDALIQERLIVQSPHLNQPRANYYLTGRGKAAAEQAAQEAGPEIVELVESIVDEVSGLGFRDLLRKVYAEAPEFAVNSVAGVETL